MNDVKATVKRGVSALVLASAATLLSHTLCADDTAARSLADSPDQLEFPIILRQPLNQLAAVGSSASFSVGAENGPLTYQWLRNGVTLSGETNSTLTVLKASVDDVGLYTCNVAKDLEIVPTLDGFDP
jgi:hypothetical protein